MGVFPRTAAMKLILLVGALLALTAAIPEPEATAEAEPWYGYGYGYRGYGGYAGYYRPYGYGYWGRKRRSAEPNAVAAAEPTAEAEPAADAAAYYGYRRGYYGGYGRRGYYGYYGKRSAEPSAAAEA